MRRVAALKTPRNPVSGYHGDTYSGRVGRDFISKFLISLVSPSGFEPRDLLIKSRVQDTSPNPLFGHYFAERAKNYPYKLPFFCCRPLILDDR